MTPRLPPSPTLRARVRVRLLLALLAALLGLAAPLGARAAGDSIEVVNAYLERSVDDESWLLTAEFEVPLPDRLIEAVERGVPLYFVMEFELYHPRWYWWDERVAQASRAIRLSYHALTRQYRVTVDGFQTSYSTLEGAMRALSSVRGWRVMDAAGVRPGLTYDAFVRMRLDVSQLPKPFQVTAITNRDWKLQAEWKRFVFAPEIPRSAQ